MTIPVPYWMLQQGVRLVSATVSALKSFTLQADTSCHLTVKVVTRLGDIPARGVKVKIADADFGTTDAAGLIKDGDQAKKHKLEGQALTITGSYKNDTEKLREETFTIALTEIDVGAKTLKAKTTHEIKKVRNAPGETSDVDFKTEHEATTDIVWMDEDGALSIAITVKLCTFSLAAPYMNQRSQNDTVQTRPGLADGKDPETAAHAVRGTANDGKFMGGVLCYPTSVKMLLEYWSVNKQRADIMQECYDRWSREKFPDRLDKRSTTTSSATAPASPPQGKY